MLMTRFLNITFLVLTLAVIPSLASAGEFQVSPIMLDLGKTNKSGTITVSNAGTEKINLQIQAMEWKQDAEGKDQYSGTNDIIYFPKIVAVDKGDSQLIRVGIKEGLTEREKTYRLYIQEIPDPGKTAPDKGKFQIAVMIRFGVPIFIKPVIENLKGIVGPVAMAKGTASAVVKNTGNVHLKIITVTVRGRMSDGQEVFSKELQGWYLLAGAVREYSAAIPQDVCLKLAQIEVNVKSEELTFSGIQSITKEMCHP
jgi:fimbrial chaperone protein